MHLRPATASTDSVFHGYTFPYVVLDLDVVFRSRYSSRNRGSDSSMDRDSDSSRVRDIDSSDLGLVMTRISQ